MQGILQSHHAAASGYSGNRRSPMAVGATIAVHVAVGALVLLMPPDTFTVFKEPPIIGYPVPEPQPPEADPPHQKKHKKETQKPSRHDPVTTVKDPEVDTTGGGTDTWTTSNSGGGTEVTTGADPVHVPVFVGPSLDPKRIRDFQPEYPGAMVRAQTEGYATVRVHIGTDGRVESVELVDTNDSAFWKVTRDQALRKWRFRPATRDGVAVPSERVMTVRFKLSDL